MDKPAAQRTELLLQQESVKTVLENSCADLIYPKGISPSNYQFCWDLHPHGIFKLHIKISVAGEEESAADPHNQQASLPITPWLQVQKLDSRFCKKRLRSDFISLQTVSAELLKFYKKVETAWYSQQYHGSPRSWFNSKNYNNTYTTLFRLKVN